MLYGRDRERAEIGELLEAARQSRSGVLVLRGEPGIGKTALLEDTRARAVDMHVLAARGVEAEYELPYASLHQLLRPALDVLDAIPEPQAEALGSALGLRHTDAAPPRFLVFAGVLSVLSELADHRPVVCLIDDAQWLDDGSGDALRFVARRLDAEGVVLLFGAREGDARTFDAPDLPSLQLAGLGMDDAANLLRRDARVPPVPAVYERLAQETRGNALALLELTATLSDEQLNGTAPLPDMLPLSSQVEALFLEQVHGLPEDTQQALLLAAADERESLSLVTRACKVAGLDPACLDHAESRGLIVVSGGRITFRHPLVRSAVYGSAGAGERRGAHAALAQALADDPTHLDDRAWHLAASSLGADPAAIRALDEAAARARGRSAYSAAARALARAVELAPEEPDAARRLVEAANCASLVGDDDLAVPLAEQAQRRSLTAAQEVEIARVFGIATVRVGSPAQGVPRMLRAARACLAHDPEPALQLALDAFWLANQGDAHASVREALDLVQAAPPAATRDSQFVIDMLGGLRQLNTGDPGGAVSLQRAIAWGHECSDPRHAVMAGVAAIAIGQDETAAALCMRSADLARESGAIGHLVPALGTLALQSIFAQRYDAAEVAAAELLSFSVELGQPNADAVAKVVSAHAAAIRGDEARARELAESTLEHARRLEYRIVVATSQWALALLDITNSRWEDALTRFRDLPQGEMSRAMARQTYADQIEAAVRAGQRDQASGVLDLFETWAASAGTPRWVRPRLASCRALLADGDEATTHFEDAVEAIGDARPHDAARIHLLYGEHLRRMRRRTDAREQLRAAVAGFEQLGAAPWAERASGELRATGETARKRDPSTASQLTPQEALIARYVAEGLSNKDVAARLFLSRRTVDYHLRNVYAKLNITSRMQLAGLALGGAPLSAAAETATV